MKHYELKLTVVVETDKDQGTTRDIATKRTQWMSRHGFMITNARVDEMTELQEMNVEVRPTLTDAVKSATPPEPMHLLHDRVDQESGPCRVAKSIKVGPITRKP